MTGSKRKKLEAAGWRVGSADELLDASKAVASWVAVYDNEATHHAIWHITHAAVRLDGMSSVVSPEKISTWCRASLDRFAIRRTSRVKPELLNAEFCACCEHALRIPEGWTFEPLPRDADRVLLSTPSPRSYMATVDFRARGFRSGYSVTGRLVGDEWNKKRKKYGGRNWRQALVDDAVAHLQEVL